METGPTPEQRAAYANWLVADEAALDARDAVLQAVQSGTVLSDLDELDRLCAFADALRRRADAALQIALNALNLRSALPEGALEPTWHEAEARDSRLVHAIRAIVDIEVHEIGRKTNRRTEESANQASGAVERNAGVGMSGRRGQIE